MFVGSSDPSQSTSIANHSLSLLFRFGGVVEELPGSLPRLLISSAWRRHNMTLYRESSAGGLDSRESEIVNIKNDIEERKTLNGTGEDCIVFGVFVSR